jgi:hypothetical protein
MIKVRVNWKSGDFYLRNLEEGHIFPALCLFQGKTEIMPNAKLKGKELRTQ